MKTKVLSSSTISKTPQSNPIAMSRVVSGEERDTVRMTGVGGIPKWVMTTSTNSETHEGGVPTRRMQGTRCIHSPNLCDKEDYLCLLGSCVFDAEACICWRLVLWSRTSQMWRRLDWMASDFVEWAEPSLSPSPLFKKNIFWNVEK